MSKTIVKFCGENQEEKLFLLRKFRRILERENYLVQLKNGFAINVQKREKFHL